MKPPPTIADIAEAYHARGFKPVPLDRGSKNNTNKSWQKKPYDPHQFNANAQNIGLQMGEVSRGLTDIDCDAAEAVRLAPFFLPATPAVYGRNSKPCSHWLYITDLWRTEKKAVIPFEDHGCSSSCAAAAAARARSVSCRRACTSPGNASPGRTAMPTPSPPAPTVLA